MFIKQENSFLLSSAVSPATRCGAFYLLFHALLLWTWVLVGLVQTDPHRHLGPCELVGRAEAAPSLLAVPRPPMGDSDCQAGAKMPGQEPSWTMYETDNQQGPTV